MRNTLTALVTAALLTSCSTSVIFTDYSDGSRRFEHDTTPVPVGVTPLASYESKHKAPLKVKLSTIAAYTIGLPITLSRDIYNISTGKDLCAKQNTKMCFENGGCTYNPVENSETKLD